MITYLSSSKTSKNIHRKVAAQCIACKRVGIMPSTNLHSNFLSKIYHSSQTQLKSRSLHTLNSSKHMFIEMYLSIHRDNFTFSDKDHSNLKVHSIKNCCYISARKTNAKQPHWTKSEFSTHREHSSFHYRVYTRQAATWGYAKATSSSLNGKFVSILEVNSQLFCAHQM